MRNGLAEIIKHGVVADADYFHLARKQIPGILAGRHTAREAGDAKPPDATGATTTATSATGTSRSLRALISGSARIKAEVVSADHREAARRHVLNFGHTVGHAIEQITRYEVQHGDAVAIGMVVEARIAAKLGLADAKLAGLISEMLNLAGLPTAIPDGLDPRVILDATRMDKKARDGGVRYALPIGIGEMSRGDGSWAVPVDDEMVLACLEVRE